MDRRNDTLLITIDDFIKHFTSVFKTINNLNPWEITSSLSGILSIKMNELDTSEFFISEGVAIHRKAVVEDGAILKGPAIICEGCFVAANAYLRNGVYLGKGTSVGPACEIKTSLIFDNTRVAHFNFIGDSIIGSNTNFEAGSIIANYYNELENKRISMLHNSKVVLTNTEKFGSLVGDNCKIGANAVLSPGTLLKPGTIVQRLQLIQQVNQGGITTN